MEPSLTWLGSAGLSLDLAGGERIYVDPWLASPAFPDSERNPDRVDAILVTHAHGDHAGSVSEISRAYNAPVFAQTEVSAWLASHGAVAGLPLGMNKGGTVAVCGVEVTMVHAVHSSAAGEKMIGDAAGFVLELPEGVTVYVAGDTDVFSDMSLIADIYRPDIAVLPVGGLMTMGPRQAAHAQRLLGNPWVLPYHWGSSFLPGTASGLRDMLGTTRGSRVLYAVPGERIALLPLIVG